mgnify:CR=1 FL=1
MAEVQKFNVDPKDIEFMSNLAQQWWDKDVILTTILKIQIT